MTELLGHWVSGELTPLGRVLTALAPALLLILWFVGGLLVYAVRTRLHGAYRDEEIESRGSSILVGMWLRQYFGWLTRPIVSVVLRSGIPPNAVTTLSVLLATGAGVSLAAGRFALGGWLFVFAGICDFLDGRVARRTGQASPRGALLDSVLDRYSDAVVLAGLGWYYRSSFVLLIVLLALIGSMLVPYIRARAEGLHVVMKDVGLMQRTERIVYLGAAVALSPILEALIAPLDPAPPHRLAIVGLAMLALSTNVTAFQRLRHGLAALAEPRPPELVSRRERIQKALARFAGITLDIALTLVLVTAHSVDPAIATIAGAGYGSLVELTVNRHEHLAPGNKAGHAARYTLVSVTSALLNGGGVALLLLLPSMDFRIAWVLVRLAVTLTWTVPLRRDYIDHPPLGQLAEGGGGRIS